MEEDENLWACSVMSAEDLEAKEKAENEEAEKI